MQLRPEKPKFTDPGQVTETLVQHYRRILETEHDAYETVLLNCRKLAEHICSYYFISAKTERRPSLSDMIHSLKGSAMLPDEIINSLYPVKSYGNLAAHPGSARLTPEMTMAVKYHIHIILDWFFRENNLSYQLPPCRIVSVKHKRRILKDKLRFLSPEEFNRNKTVFEEALHARNAEDPKAALIILNRIDYTTLKDADLIGYITIVSSHSGLKSDLGIARTEQFTFPVIFLSLLKGTLIFYLFKYGPEYLFYSLFFSSAKEKKIKKIQSVLEQRYL